MLSKYFLGNMKERYANINFLTSSSVCEKEAHRGKWRTNKRYN